MPKISKTTASSHDDVRGRDAFVIEPGHTPLAFEVGEYMAFTTIEDTNWRESVMMPNLAEFARSLGLEIPEQIKQMKSAR